MTVVDEDFASAPTAAYIFGKNKIPRWLMAVFAALFLVLLSGGAWFHQVQGKRQREDALADLRAIAHFKADQIARWRTECLADAGAIMENPFIRKAVTLHLTNPGTESAEAILTWFRSLQKRYGFADVVLADTRGVPLLSLSGRTAPFIPEVEKTLATALQEHRPLLTDLHVGPDDPQPHIEIVAPVLAATGQGLEPIGAIIQQTDARQFLYPLIRSWPVRSDSAETLLVRQDRDAVLFLNDLRHQKGTALSLRIPLSRGDVPAVMAVLGREGEIEGKDYRGMEVLAVLKAIPDSSWFMVAKVDKVEALAELRRESALLLGLLAALAASWAAAVLLMWQRNMKAHYRALYRSEALRRAALERYGITLNAIGDAVISTDAQGRVDFLTPVAESLTGWKQGDARGKAVTEVFRIVNEETRQAVENPVTRVLREGAITGLANHTLLIARDGREFPIADSGAPIRDSQGEITGVVLVFRDQTEERLERRVIEMRLSLIEYAADHALQEFLTRALDEVGDFVASPLGFYHFVEPDQKTLSLQQWSTRTLQEFCRAEGKGMHYDTDRAGVWVDCVHEKRPVVHNDYASLPHKKGMPQGHAEVVRELVVPVMRGGKVVAVLGVGNKPHDYTDKDVEIVSYLADVTWQIVEQKRAEEVLKQSEHKYKELYEEAPVGYHELDAEGRITRVNQRELGMLGYTADDMLNRHVWEFICEGKVSEQAVREKLAGIRHPSNGLERTYRRKDGTMLAVGIDEVLLKDERGRIIGIRSALQDITEQKRAEEERERLQAQLLQAQKMESVGRLAGGVAHDFNNMLGIIIGNAELAQLRVDPAHPLSRNIQEILNASERSADLVRQLLAFARKQTVSPRVLDLNDTISGMLKMLRRLIGEDIELAWMPGHDLWQVKMDPTQIDQILANLTVNARDAISGVGRLTIETGNVVFDEAYCAEHAGFVPGQYVLLAVSDDGAGMSQEILGHLFEPFFTTKEIGKGTGLGLATIYGIVKQNEGFVNVYSEPGNGTTFKIYLRRFDDSGVAEVSRPGQEEELPEGTETVLLVEDEEGILHTARGMLEALGYRVLAARTITEAMRQAEEHGGEIHLLITDVVMPEMNGRELADRLTSIRPGMKTLFMSGYTANVIAHQGILDPGLRFIEKPFSVKALAAKVREVLEK